MKRTMLISTALLAVFAMAVSVTYAATEYTWYPQSWTVSGLNDAGSGHPAASGEIHYRVHSGLEINPTTHLPNGLPGFTEYYWTGTPCEVRLDDDTSAPVYHLLEYNAILKDESDNTLDTVYVGCPIFGNPDIFAFENFPADGEEYTARVVFEDANTNEEIAYTDLMEFGKPEVEETDPIGDIGFVNDYTSLKCYKMCRYDPTMPFDNCGEYYGTTLSDARSSPGGWYSYAMTWYYDHGYCDWD